MGPPGTMTPEELGELDTEIGAEGEPVTPEEAGPLVEPEIDAPPLEIGTATELDTVEPVPDPGISEELSPADGLSPVVLAAGPVPGVTIERKVLETTEVNIEADPEEVPKVAKTEVVTPEPEAPPDGPDKLTDGKTPETDGVDPPVTGTEAPFVSVDPAVEGPDPPVSGMEAAVFDIPELPGTGTDPLVTGAEAPTDGDALAVEGVELPLTGKEPPVTSELKVPGTGMDTPLDETRTDADGEPTVVNEPVTGIEPPVTGMDVEPRPGTPLYEPVDGIKAPLAVEALG